MDAVGKRIVFFQAVTLLQVAKIYQWYMHSWTWQTVGFWQWLFIDILVLLYANRASLKFPVSHRLVYLGLFSFFLCLNLFLAHTAGSTVLASLFGISVVPVIPPRVPKKPFTTDSEDATKEHPFNGSLIIHVKPYARIRPENNPVSLGAKIPLAMRGRAPWRLTYKISNWIGFSDPYEQIMLNTIVVPAEPPHFLNASHVGYYTLVSVRDVRNEEGRVGNETVRVVEGPFVSLHPSGEEPKPTAHFHSKHILRVCLGRELHTVVKILGIRPFKLVIEREHNGRTTVIPFNNLHQHHDRYFRIPLGTLNEPGMYKWSIKSVTDAFNLTTAYLPVTDPPDEVPEMKVEVYDLPVASLSTSSLFIAENKTASVHVNLHGHSPFSVVIQQPSPNGGYSQQTLNETASFSFTAQIPGVYRLISARDGILAEPSSVQLEVLPPPTLAIDPLPLVSSCLGEASSTVMLKTTGRPPWTVTYSHKIYDQTQHHLETHTFTVNIHKSPYSLQLIPRIAGHHNYTFSLLTDALYKDLILENVHHNFTVFERPTARMIEDKLRACQNSAAQLNLHLQGRPPFSLDYVVTSPSGNKTEKNEILEHATSALNIGLLDSAGHYSVLLTRISDATGCSHPLDQEATISVMSPTARLICGGDRSMLRTKKGGHLRVEMSEGEPPYSLQYQTSNGAVQSVTGIQLTSHLIPLEDNGVITLVSVEDSKCPGTVDSPNTCTIQVVGTPSVSVTPGIAPRGCVREAIHIASLNFTGEGPWDLVYEETVSPIALPGSKKVDDIVTKKSLTIASPDNYLFSASSPHAGGHKYKFLSLSDRHYDFVSLAHLPVLSVDVQPRPTITWRETAKEYYVCTGSQVLLKVLATGKAPFTLRYSVTFQDTRDVKTVLMGKAEGSILIDSLVSVGLYEVNLLDIEDANGCKFGVGPNQKIVIHSGAGARLSLPDPTDSCRGDKLRIDFLPEEGGPWEFGYRFRNKTITKVSTTSQYIFQADEAGVMEFSWVKNQFCNETSSAHYHIHRLPSGALMNGKDVKASVVEGDSVDIILDLLGDPPFNVTLQKTHFFEDTIETYELKGINAHHYVLPAHEEGEYFITYVGDKYCKSYREPNTKR